MTASFFETLVQAARWAPSGDNRQPWEFPTDQGPRTLNMRVHHGLDRSPMNAGQRMTWIAAGAAAENVVFTAGAEYSSEVNVTEQNSKYPLVTVEFSPVPCRLGEVPEIIRQRVTNRRLYHRKPVDQKNLESFKQGRVRVIWNTDRGTISTLAAVIGEADALMFGMEAVRKAFLENVCFKRRPTDEVEEGLSLGSLEANWMERIGLRVIREFPAMFRWLSMARKFRQKAIDLVESASGLCILVATGDDATTDFDVGQLMERAWLELTRQNFAVQPMMSLPVLDNMLSHLAKESLPPSLGQETESFTEAFQTVLNTENNERIAAILRFGYAPPPTSRTSRRPIRSS